MQGSGREPSEPDRALAAEIRRRRRALGLTQDYLARACGVSFQQLQKYENGTNRVSFSRLVQIAHALSTTVADLTAVLESDARAASGAALVSVASEYERFRDVPEADKLLRFYAALTPVGRAVLVDFLSSVPGELEEAVRGEGVADRVA